MARHPITDPEAARPIGSEAEPPELQTKPNGLESDFDDLAARFSAASGGGLPAALSADLALQIVLNEIVEQACLATGATGAALALQREGELICNATAGSTTPELGARLDVAAGLCADCVRARRTQICNDVLADTRPEVQSLQRLGARSAAAVPLLHGEKVVGVFEVFSSRPAAFGERDERTLEALGHRAVINLERAAQAPRPPVETEPAVFPVGSQALERLRDKERAKDFEPEDLPADVAPQEIPAVEASIQGSSQPGTGRPARRGFDIVTWVLEVAVLLFAVLLGVLIGRHMGVSRAALRPHRPVQASAQPSAPVQDANAAQPIGGAASIPVTGPATQAPVKEARNEPLARPTRSAPSEPSVPPGGLSIYENGKEIFRMLPNKSANNTAATDRAAGVQTAAALEPEASTVVELPEAEVEKSLVHRVEPDYPEAALQQRIQGLVLLDVHIGTDGSVQGVRIAGGPPQLAQASSDAVKQWRFQPHTVKGRAVAVHTTVTLSFRLPQS